MPGAACEFDMYPPAQPCWLLRALLSGAFLPPGAAAGKSAPIHSSWPGLSRPSPSFFLGAESKDVDARDKPGHDEFCCRLLRALGYAILIRRNLNETAVGIPAIDRPQRAEGALFPDRALLDRHAAGV